MYIDALKLTNEVSRTALVFFQNQDFLNACIARGQRRRQGRRRILGAGPEFRQRWCEMRARLRRRWGERFLEGVESVGTRMQDNVMNGDVLRRAGKMMLLGALRMPHPPALHTR